MKKSRLRLGLSIAGILIASCVVGFELKESLRSDLSSERHIHRLGSYSSARRREAAAELAQFTGEADKVVPALVMALGDSDTEVRLNALESLKMYADKAKPAVTVVSSMLQHDPNGRIRQRAAALLGAIQDRNEVPILIKALDDRDSAVRLEATRSLGWFGPVIAAGPIVDKLLLGLGSDYPEEVRDATLDTLDSLARNQERVARAIADVSAKDPSSQVRNKAIATMEKPTFAFQIPALIVALDDSSPRVRLTAGTNLASVGMTDDRTVPALCRAVLKADDASREVIGLNFDLLILERANDKTPDEQVARRYQSAVREFQTVLETPGAAAREQIANVLSRLIAIYQKSGRRALFEPAQAAVKALLLRMEDEKEEISLRLHAMNQCSVIQMMGDDRSTRPSESRSDARDPKFPLHYRALWIAALGRAIKSPAALVRSRAMKLLMDNFNDPGTDPSFRDAWRKIVPILTEVTRSGELSLRIAALALLGRLGPEARESLPALRSLEHESPEAAVRSAAGGAIPSVACIDALNAKDAAVRIAAAEALGRLDWPATAGVPALIIALKDPETQVRIAAANALRTLAKMSGSAVTPLATSLTGEADAGVRVAIIEALEAIAPGTPPVLDAHCNALHDPDPSVRTAAASFQKVPTDDSAISALESALGDPSDDVRLKVAASLTEVLFANPAVIPALLKALGDDRQRKAVVEALSLHFDKTSDQADFSRVRGNLAGLTATLKTAIPTIEQTLSLKNEEISPPVYGLLGRIVSFSSLSPDEDFRKVVEPALHVYLKGLDESTPAIREQVLDRIEAIPIRREDIVSALQKFLEKPDLSPSDRQTAVLALKEQSTPTGSGARKGSNGKKGAALGIGRRVPKGGNL
jgi:HEAT repeat protein